MAVQPTETPEITIIGAGIVGVSTALWLQRAGHKATLVDKIGPAGGTSYGNGGVLASCGSVPVTVPGLLPKVPGMLLSRDAPLFLKYGYIPKLLPWLPKYLKHCNEADVKRIAAALHTVIGDSLADHQALAAGTPAEKRIVPGDYLYLYPNKASYEKDNFSWSVRRNLGIEFDLLEGKDLQSYEPAFSDAYQLAVRLPNHGRILDPGKYVNELADHFVSQGGKLVKADVTSLAFEGDHVSALNTTDGQIPVQKLVVTAGAWSGPLAKALGIKVPLESERGYHIELWGANIMPKGPIMETVKKFVITPMEGRLRVAGLVEFGGLEAPPSKAPHDLLLRQIQTAIPNLKWDRIEKWMGHRPALADSIPVIGPVSKVKNAWLGFGHHHVGLTGGPKTGWMLAQMLSGQRTNLDLVPYSPMRFDA